MSDKLVIKGGKRLKGRISVSGAKNSALKLFAASILTSGWVELSNVPHLKDVSTMMTLLSDLGAMVTLLDNNCVAVDGSRIRSREVSYDLVRAMRASIVVLGPLLGRFGKAKVAYPGGCAIGSRPIDMHIDAFKKMGVDFVIEDGFILAKVGKKGLQGAEIHFREVTVTGTENVMMAATLAKGRTILHNAAAEPEVQDLAELLIKMGAKIEGAGTRTVIIDGVKKLHGTHHRIIPDRVEAGTYLIAACATKGDIFIRGAIRAHLGTLVDKLREAGAKVEELSDGLRLVMKTRPRAVSFTTEPFPGFATDLQAQMMALACIAEGVSTIEERIFENRMMHVAELRRFGADIAVKSNVAETNGRLKLSGAPVQATELRAAAALVIAALVASGKTKIDGMHHLDRGYEYLEEKLRMLGAKVSRVRQ
jgi:UDP-N-acetylglucosamine 1-carboxyvinyltransferase